MVDGCGCLFQACEKRVEEDEEGQKHCTGQYFDYWGCIDKCVSGSERMPGADVGKIYNESCRCTGLSCLIL